MADSYKKSYFTVFGEYIDSLKEVVFPKKTSSESYPYEDGVESRWGRSSVIFGAVEKEIYTVLYNLNQQNPQSVWCLNTIELTVPTSQYDRVINFLSEEFNYTSPTSFDRNKLISLIEKNIFSLPFYQYIEIMANPKIQLILHGQNQGHAHLFENRPICINKTAIDISLFDNYSNISINNIDERNQSIDKKSVQVRIYDENGKRVVKIEKFPVTLGISGDFEICGKYVSGEHIRLDFDSNYQLIVENISKTNPIFVGDLRLGKCDNGIISKSMAGTNDLIYIGKITHDEQENKDFPRLEIVDIENGKPTPAYRKGRITPSAEGRDDRYAKPEPTPYAEPSYEPVYKEPPPTPFAKPDHTQPLFQLIVIVGGSENKIPITQLDLPCLIGRLDELPKNSTYKKLISIPSYHQGVLSTVSREHLVIDDFQDGVAVMQSLGRNGCFINNVKQVSNFSLNLHCELQLGVDSPPVKIVLGEP